MMKKTLYIMVSCVLAVWATGCSRPSQPSGERQESREAKRLLQGVWLDEDTEAAVFQVRGDTVYYADSTSQPAYFKVVGDTLYIASSQYYIEKQTAHALWFQDGNGETTRFVKSTDEALAQTFEHQRPPQILSLTEVLKRDTVVFYNGERYHLYVAINPTKYRVVHQTVNEDGLEVENVYYDNIIHLSIFKGKVQIFSRDFRKQLYEHKVSAHVLSQAVLNNMEYDKADADGFHLRASLCIPDEASCYMVGHTISYQGQLTTQLQEY